MTYGSALALTITLLDFPDSSGSPDPPLVAVFMLEILFQGGRNRRCVRKSLCGKNAKVHVGGRLLCKMVSFVSFSSNASFGMIKRCR